MNTNNILPWIVSAFIAGSLGYDLIIGESTLHGFGSYTREDSPGGYWGCIAFKTAILVGSILIDISTSKLIK